jgi:hypothetical protein
MQVHKFKIGDEVEILPNAQENYDVLRGKITDIDNDPEPYRVEGVDANGNDEYDWVRENDIQLVNNFSQGVNKVMSGIVNKVKDLTLSADDKLLRNQGVTDNQGNMTTEGQEILLAVLFEANKAEIVERVKKVVAEEKAEKK